MSLADALLSLAQMDGSIQFYHSSGYEGAIIEAVGPAGPVKAHPRWDEELLHATRTVAVEYELMHWINQVVSGVIVQRQEAGETNVDEGDDA